MSANGIIHHAIISSHYFKLTQLQGITFYKLTKAKSTRRTNLASDISYKVVTFKDRTQ